MPFPSCELMPLSIVSRASNLARAQVIEAQRMIGYFHPQIIFEPIFLESKGDKDKVTSLRELEKTNFFTDTLDYSLLEGKARLALHSAKDLPEPLPKGLTLAALTPCIDERDSLVFAKRLSFQKGDPLPKKMKVATSSKRREEAVLEIAPDAVFCDLRGTIEERLRTLENSDTDAVVLAEAALIRLGLTHLPRIFLPGKTTPGQGSLAIVVREHDQEIIDLFSILDTRQGHPKCVYLGIDPKTYQQKIPFPLIHYPIIETQSLLKKDEGLCAQTKTNYFKASHVILTSPRAAFYLMDWMNTNLKVHEVNHSLETKIWWCMGATTANFLPKIAYQRKVCERESTAEAMLPWIKEMETTLTQTPRAFVFFPHSQRSRPLLQKALEKSQIPHCALPIYGTSTKEILDVSLIQEADELIFTSPSCVESFYSQVQVSPKARLKSIGVITQLALQKYRHHSYTASTAL